MLVILVALLVIFAVNTPVSAEETKETKGPRFSWLPNTTAETKQPRFCLLPNVLKNDQPRMPVYVPDVKPEAEAKPSGARFSFLLTAEDRQRLVQRQLVQRQLVPLQLVPSYVDKDSKQHYKLVPAK